MTTAEAIVKLDLLLDKYGSPYFTQAEKINFINMAQLEFLNRLFPDSLGGSVNVELDKNTLQAIRNLIFNTGATSTGSGVIDGAILNTNLQTVSGDPTSVVFRILSAYVSGTRAPIRYTSHFSVNTRLSNTFKENTLCYTLENRYIRIYPQTTYTVDFTVVKYPRNLLEADINSGVGPDFNDYEMHQIISIAAQLASIGLRDGELLQQIQNSNTAK